MGTRLFSDGKLDMINFELPNIARILTLGME